MTQETLMIKRKRGRPPGAKKKENLSTSTVPFNITVPVKRGRGRPPKSGGTVSKLKSTTNESGYFKRLGRIITSGTCTGLTIQVFESVPDEFKVNELTAKGSRVIIAKFPDFYKIYLKKYHAPGSVGYLKGGVEVYNANYDQRGAYYLDQVALHPDGGSRRMIVLTDEDGNDMGESIPAPVAITKSDERDEKKMLKRQKKLDKEAAKQSKRDAKTAKKLAKEEKKRLKLEKRLAKQKKKEDRKLKREAKKVKLEKRKLKNSEKLKKFVKE